MQQQQCLVAVTGVAHENSVFAELEFAAGFTPACQAHAGLVRVRVTDDESRDLVQGGVGFWHLAGEDLPDVPRSEEHTSELQSLMRISYAVFCLKKKNNKHRK